MSSCLCSRLGIKEAYVKAFQGALSIAIVVLVSVFIFAIGDGRKIVLSSLYPSLLAESAVEMRWDTALWPLGFSFSVVASFLLLEAVGKDDYPSHLLVVLFVLLAAGITALWSANPLTTIVAWAFYDLAFALGSIAAGGSREDAVRRLALGTGAGLLLWVGVLVAEGGIGSVQWALMPTGGAKMTYWMLAGFFRLGVYPLHISFPRHIRSDSPLVGAFFLGPVLGWGLWIRLALVGGSSLPVGTWMAVPALLTLVGGALLGWTASSSRECVPWISMGGNGAVLLATVLASLWDEGRGIAGATVVPTMTLGAAGWMLGTTMLSSGDGLDPRRFFRAKSLPRNVLLLIGALSLMGTPATVGFVAESSLLGELVKAGRWAWTISFFIGQVFLVAAVMRWLFASDPVEGEGRGPLGEIVYSIGLVGLAGSLVAIGIAPKNLLLGMNSFLAPSLESLLAGPGLAGWLLWGGALLLGSILAWLDASLRPRISLWLTVLHDVLLLDWGYDLLMGAFEQGFGVLRVVDDILNGRGALLWACIVVLMLALVVGI